MLANIADNTASQSFWVGALLLVRNRYIIPTIKAASRVSLKSIMNSFIKIKLNISLMITILIIISINDIVKDISLSSK